MDVPADTDPLYAQLGLALYQSQALEYALVSLYAETLKKRESFWTLRLQQLMNERHGNQVHHLLESLVLDLELLPGFLPRLQHALINRNWLLHHFYHDLGRAAYDRESAISASMRLKHVSDSIGALVLDLNEVLFDRQLQYEAEASERNRVERSILQYMERAELF